MLLALLRCPLCSHSVIMNLFPCLVRAHGMRVCTSRHLRSIGRSRDGLLVLWSGDCITNNAHKCFTVHSPQRSSQQKPRTYHAIPTPEALPVCQRDGESDSNQELDFTRPEVIYRSKRSSELLRGLLVLQLSSFDRLVNNSLKLMTVGQRLIGRRLFEGLMRRTFFGQFAVEGRQGSVEAEVQRLQNCGIASIFALTAEEDVGEDIGSFDEDCYDRNLAKMLYSLELTDQMCRFEGRPKLTQLKVTSYLKADVLAKITVLMEETGSDLRSAGTISLNNFMAGLNGNMQGVPECTEEEMEHLQRALLRFDHIAQKAASLDVHLLVDAEKENINPGINLITLAMMRKYNQRRSMVWNTYQCYLKVTEARLKSHILLADEEGFCFGVKLVRGAYMDGEKNNARDLGCDDPVQPSYEATNATYDKMVEYLMRRCLEATKPEVQFIIASHNEESVLKAVALMKKLGVSSSFDKIVFGQVYGMCDHVSYALGQAEHLVYKSIPVGAVEEVLAYLSRRAQENNTAFHRLQAEKGLLKTELRRRLLSRS